MHPSPELYPWISAGAIAWGMLDCFFGYGIFKITLAVLGGLAGVVFGQAAGAALGLGQSGLVAGMVISGLLGTILAFLCYIAAVFVAGFGFGATLGILLLSNFNEIVALASSCVMGIAGGFLAVRMQRALIMLSTALLGAFRAVLALSYFTNQMDWLFYFQRPRQIPVLIDNNAWMLPAILVLAAMGVAAQSKLGGATERSKT